MKYPLTFLIALLLLAAAISVGFAQQKSDVALLIGNASYPDAEAPLKEPLRDVHALGDELRRRGFDVDVGENLTKEAMQHSLDRFYEKIKTGATVVLFFSGYGIQSDRQNYMIPVDARIWSEADVRRDGFSLEKVLNDMNGKGAGVKIVILDASRRNPYERRFRSVSAGLAAVTAPTGTLVMSAASPGSVLEDKGEPVFMRELIKELNVAQATVEQVFNRTRMDVLRATKSQQVPWFSSSLEEEFAFASPTQGNAPAPPSRPEPKVQSAAKPPSTSTPPVKPAPSTTAPAKPAPTVTAAKPEPGPDPEADALHDYVAAERLGTRQAWDDFLKKHQSGVYHDLAQEKVAKLEEKPSEPLPAAKPPSANETSEPASTSDYYERGVKYAKAGDYLRAIRDFDEVIRRDPKNAEALNDRCWTRALVGELEGALKDCNEALRLDPGYADALDSRGLVNLKSGRLGEAISDYDSALKAQPKRAPSLYGRGIAKLRRGNVDSGNSDIGAAKAIQPNIANEFAGYGIR
jgi:tetratricopeptide (TPR) repeat protein